MPINGNRELVRVGGHQGDVVFNLFDLKTAQPLRTLRIPEAFIDLKLQAAAPVGRRLLASYTRAANQQLALWDLDRPTNAAKEILPVGNLPVSTHAAFSPDGRLIAVFGEHLSILDSCDLQPVSVAVQTRTFVYSQGQFFPDSKRLLVNETGRTLPIVYDPFHGKVISYLREKPTFNASDVAISSDGCRIAASSALGTASSFIVAGFAISLWDAQTGTELGRTQRASYDLSSPQFFPNSHRFIAAGPTRGSTAVYDDPGLPPLVTLQTPDYDNVYRTAISSDGRYIAALTAQDSGIFFTPGFESSHAAQTIHLYRRTGWDCPESRTGALAFPHTWLLIALTTALTVALQRDARRQSLTPSIFHPLSSILVFSLLLFALPRTLQAILTAAVEHKLLLTPAPLLLIAAIGLASASRFWRLATLILLAAQLPLNLYCLHLLRKSDSYVIPILDRTWTLPSVPIMIPLAAATLAIPFAIYQLARTPARTHPY